MPRPRRLPLVIDEPLQASLDAFQEGIGYRFRKLHLLVAAITHTSAANATEQPTFLEHNERMEFLGDAILDFIISEYLYRKKKKDREGLLTQKRSMLVNAVNLREKALSIGLDKVLILSKGEEKTGGRLRTNLLGDTFEALVAALYLDGGMRKTKNWVISLFREELDGNLEREQLVDSLSRLYELAQDKVGNHPRFVVTKEDGPQHARVFHVEVRFHDMVVGHGAGRNKKSARQIAAAEALETRDQWLPQVLEHNGGPRRSRG